MQKDRGRSSARARGPIVASPPRYPDDALQSILGPPTDQCLMNRVTDHLGVLHRFERLIQAGRDILISAGWDGRRYKSYKPGGSQCVRLRTQALALLKELWGEQGEPYRRLDALTHSRDANANGSGMAETVAILESACRDFQREFLFARGDLASVVEDEFIELAEALFNAGGHVASAQRAGAVLAQRLVEIAVARKLIKSADSTVLNADQLNDALASAGIYDAATQRRIAACLQICRDASGPNADRIHAEDVAEMLARVRLWSRGLSP